MIHRQNHLVRINGFAENSAKYAILLPTG